MLLAIMFCAVPVELGCAIWAGFTNHQNFAAALLVTAVFSVMKMADR